MKFLSALAILFIALKLCGVIAWSWWLVLLPLYITILVVVGMVVLFLGGAFGLAGALKLYDKIKSKFNKNKR